MPVSGESAPPDSSGFLADLRAYQRQRDIMLAADSGESLEILNVRLLIYLSQRLQEEPDLINFRLPDNDSLALYGLRSRDSAVHIYNWDTRLGGATHFYDGLIAYKTASGALRIKSLLDSATRAEQSDPARAYDEVYVMRSSGATPIYLASFENINSNTERYAGIQAWRIDGDSLVEAPVFRVGTEFRSLIDYTYELSAAHIHGQQQFPQIRLINRDLTIPLIAASGEATGRSIRYRFNGEHFVYVPPPRKASRK